MFVLLGFAAGDATALEMLLVFLLPALAFGWLSWFPSELREGETAATADRTSRTRLAGIFRFR